MGNLTGSSFTKHKTQTEEVENIEAYRSSPSEAMLKPSNMTGRSNKTPTKSFEAERSSPSKERSSPYEAVLTSAIDQLMTNLDKEKQTKGDLKKKKKKHEDAAKDKETYKDKEKAEKTREELEEKTDDLLVCGVISTSTGKISVVRPRNALVQTGSDFKLGMAKNTFADFKLGMTKLQFFAPRLFKGKLTLATVIAATRLPQILISNK